MADAIRYLGQGVFYALFFLPVVYFSHQPQHQHLPEGMAELKLSLIHI